ncbi:MAG: RNA polymerase sigma-70 factor [Prolixibacteraceae bacterium]|nr:RNA polymerase sigma-70 factor [Prolixibacteraceae bacterium]
MGKESDHSFSSAFDCVEYKTVFDTLYEPLCRFCYRYVLSNEIAEDIVQDTFAYLWESWQRLSEMESLKAYLYTAVKNRSLKYLKKNFAKSPALTIEGYTDDIIDLDQPTAQELLEYRDLQAIVEQALKQLPERCRIIFVLKRFDGKTNKEIAQLLNISVKTVETQMTIAIKRLTSIVSKKWESGAVILLNVWISAQGQVIE